MSTHQIWILDPEGWDEIGTPIPAKVAEGEANEWRSHGYRVRVLPTGVKPNNDPRPATQWDNVT